MAITAQQVKALREKTGAGMMDCKKALTEAGGDEEQAVAWLREKGLAKAKKRADRATTEGLISQKIGDSAAVMIEVMCETDFVAKSDKFQDFVAKATSLAFENNPETPDQLLAMSIDSGKTLNDDLNEMIAVLGESIQMGSIIRLELQGPGAFGSYVHSNGKIGVLVEFGTEKDASSEEFQEIAKGVAMQVAALSPLCVRSEEVPADMLEKEKEIYRKQALDEGKPPEIAEKIVEGRMNKYFKEVCLLDQPFVKDDKKSVDQIVKSFDKDITVRRFVRMELGAQNK
jgi:elongation factor Ts